jgi:hypothetical protein
VPDIAIREPATTHAVSLQQVERWLAGATTNPNEAVAANARLEAHGRASSGVRPYQFRINRQVEEWCARPELNWRPPA